MELRSSTLSTGIVLLVYAGISWFFILIMGSYTYMKRSIKHATNQRKSSMRTPTVTPSIASADPSAQNKQTFTAGPSGLTDNMVYGGTSITDNPVARMIEKVMFHTFLGRSFDLGILSFTNAIKTVSTLMFVGAIRDWIDYEISLSDLPGQSRITVMGVTFIVLVCVQVGTQLCEGIINEHMGMNADIIGKLD